MPRARSVLLLLLFLLGGSRAPPALHAQDTRSRPILEREADFYLEQNYPNPVKPETWIPFYLGEELFAGRDTVHVSLRIYNMLGQVVAIPEAVDTTTEANVPVVNLGFTTPGRKLAYWNGKDTAGRSLPTNVYYCQLVVDGRLQTRKMVVDNPRRRRSIIPWLGKPKDRSR